MSGTTPRNVFYFAACCLFLLVAASSVVVGQKLYHGQKGTHPEEVYGLYSALTSIPETFILTNESTPAILNQVATQPEAEQPSQRAIIFTTLRLGDAPEDEVLGMISTFCYHLNNTGMLKHTLLITTEDHTWELLHARGFPAYLDRSFPRRSAYVQSVLPSDTYNREFDVQKHWWGWNIINLGYRALYLDSDAITLQNPLEPFDESAYDVQGLSDWDNEANPDNQEPGSLSGAGCGLYYQVTERRVPSGSMLKEYWHIPGGQTALAVVNPCQSTGLWYLQPNDITVRFMRAMVDRIAYHAVWQWDQTAWNEVIMPFLVGMGYYPQLRYRLLPNDKYSNIGVYRARIQKELPVNQVILHLGGVHGADKQRIYEEEGLYHPDFSAARDGSSINDSVFLAATMTTKEDSSGVQSLQSAAINLINSNISSSSHTMVSGFILLGVVSFAAAVGLFVWLKKKRGGSGKRNTHSSSLIGAHQVAVKRRSSTLSSAVV